MALQNQLKRRSIKGSYFWTLPYLPEIKQQAQDLGFTVKRKSAFNPSLKRNTWVYSLFPAKGDLRSKSKASDLITFEEVAEAIEIEEPVAPIVAPPQVVFQEMPLLLNQAFEEKNVNATVKLQEVMDLFELGRVEEAVKIFNEVKKELSEERTFTFKFELRDEFQT